MHAWIRVGPSLALTLGVAVSSFAGAPPSPRVPPDPAAVTIASLPWDSTFIVSIDEGTLVALEAQPGRGHERVTVSDPDFVREVARLYAKLAPLPSTSPVPRDFRMLALLVSGDGSSRRVGIPGGCDAMTRDGQPVAFSRELHELLASRLTETTRRALDGPCAVKQARSEAPREAVGAAVPGLDNPEVALVDAYWRWHEAAVENASRERPGAERARFETAIRFLASTSSIEAPDGSFSGEPPGPALASTLERWRLWRAQNRAALRWDAETCGVRLEGRAP